MGVCTSGGNVFPIGFQLVKFESLSYIFRSKESMVKWKQSTRERLKIFIYSITPTQKCGGTHFIVSQLDFVEQKYKMLCYFNPNQILELGLSD